MKKHEKSFGKRFGVREKVFRRGTSADRSREIEENENRIATTQYIALQ